LDNNNSMILKSQRQDKTAFEQLVKTYSKWLLGLTASLSSYEEAEDIAQDIWMLVWKHLSSLKDPNKFKAWLRMVAIREITRKRKVISLNNKNRVDIDGDENQEIISDVERQDIKIDKKETFDALCARLTAEQKDTLVLYALEGLNIKEVAELLKVPSGTVKSRINTIRKIAIQQSSNEQASMQQATRLTKRAKT
jgi:RNA polymerase sigma factor (sigma-70 family)